MAVRTETTSTQQGTTMDAQRLYELVVEMRDDIREIKERLERIDKPINSGKDE
jgi:hypothetical protein